MIPPSAGPWLSVTWSAGAPATRRPELTAHLPPQRRRLSAHLAAPPVRPPRPARDLDGAHNLANYDTKT